MNEPVNKKRYRYPDTDKRRAYMRDYMKRYRAGKKDGGSSGDGVGTGDLSPNGEAGPSGVLAEESSGEC